MSLHPALRVVRGAAPLLAVALAAPSFASAQATRTWVSGVGDDVNPCSRTAPCKTFAGAISKTAAGGEINTIDPGGYGAVTITKSITIDGRGTNASILAAGTTGVIINAPAGSKVTLRNLSINGVRNSTSAGVSGVRIIGASSLVRIDKVDIFGFATAGVDFAGSTAGNRRLEIRRSSIHDNYGTGANGVGVWTRPAAAGVNARTTIRDSYIDDNGKGVVADSALGSARVTITGSSIEDSGFSGGTGQSIQAFGANSTVRISDNVIANNIFGPEALSGAQIISFGDNVISNDGPASGPTSTVPKS
jgi:hypothetical protein